MSLGPDVIVLWLAGPEPGACDWTSAAPRHLLFTRCAPAMMAGAIPAAVARGPVVAIVDDDRLAHQALALGVDEVLRVDLASLDTVNAAAERARLRAVGRDARPRALDADDRAPELLGASVTYRLVSPLASAQVNLEILSSALDAVAGLADAYVQRAAGKRELLESEAQRIIALRASAPGTAELRATVQCVASALQEAASAVAQMYALVAPDGADDACDLSVVVPEIATIVRAVVERSADFRLEVCADEPCVVGMPRSVVVQAISALLSNAVQAVADCQGRRAVTLRVVPRSAAALIEVIDNGVGMTPTVLERAPEAFFTTRGKGAAGLGLSLAVERIRRLGGEIVLESEHGSGTTARIFIPMCFREPKGDPNLN
jgi:signal transduction histidine kinase